MMLLTNVIRKFRQVRFNYQAVHVFFISGLLVFLGIVLTIVRAYTLASIIFYTALLLGFPSFLLLNRKSKWTLT